MEAALGRMAALVSKKEGELQGTRRLVQKECDERARLLALVQQLQGQAGAGGPRHTVVPLAAMGSLPEAQEASSGSGSGGGSGRAAAQRDRRVVPLERRPGGRGLPPCGRRAGRGG
mmetsp:Transcript_13838/g.40628  ORF Transcript_13838/g.40628 Transcript_13838/m.40628 type:complete len:116 (-) Transcript_13838:281-628(-)